MVAKVNVFRCFGQCSKIFGSFWIFLDVFGRLERLVERAIITIVPLIPFVHLSVEYRNLNA